MKSSVLKSIAIAVATVACLFLGDSVRAAVTTINSPGSSLSAISFADTNSVTPSITFGTTYNQNVSPWGGGTSINNTLPLTTDPTTSDFAKGNINASVVAGNYSLTFNSVTLNQAALNTGRAQLTFAFSVEFQLDASGLPSQATVFPNFLINGTVQNAAGSFAAIKGFINYTGVNTAGTVSLLDTVNYNSTFNTPGNFSSVVNGVPVFGTTPALAPNTTLTVSGAISFIVDPASFDVESVVVPEPGSGLLVGFALLSGLLWRLTAQRRSRSA